MKAALMFMVLMDKLYTLSMDGFLLQLSLSRVYNNLQGYHLKSDTVLKQDSSLNIIKGMVAIVRYRL